MSKRWALPLLLVLFALAYLLPLGTHGLWIPDETRYAQISQDMLLSGNWVSPHFMSLRYFEKPAAGYWMIAASQALFGQNLFGVRFASALSTGLSVLLCYLIARRMWNEPRKSFACALLYMSFTVIAGAGGLRQPRSAIHLLGQPESGRFVVCAGQRQPRPAPDRLGGAGPGLRHGVHDQGFSRLAAAGADRPALDALAKTLA